MKSFVKFFGLVSLSIGMVFGVGSASEALAAEEGISEDSEYNFSWLDPEKKIYVLQNRRYRKAKRVSLFLMGGSGIAETYRQTWQVEPRIGVWFNEDFGIEGFFAFRTNSGNNSYRALVNATGSGLSPLIREKNTFAGVLLNWAPWYAKINVFNSILYFDWYFSGGAGTIGSSIGQNTKAEKPLTWRDENLFAVFLGTGQLFHLSDTVDARFEFMGHFYSADVFGGVNSAPIQQSIFSNFAVSIGIGVKL